MFKTTLLLLLLLLSCFCCSIFGAFCFFFFFSNKDPCKQSCKIWSCHKDNIDPGNTDRTKISGILKSLTPENKLKDNKEKFVITSNGRPIFCDEEFRSSVSILSPYLSIISFLLSRCHSAAVENFVEEGEEV